MVKQSVTNIPTPVPASGELWKEVPERAVISSQEEEYIFVLVP